MAAREWMPDRSPWMAWSSAPVRARTLTS